MLSVTGAHFRSGLRAHLGQVLGTWDAQAPALEQAAYEILHGIAGFSLKNYYENEPVCPRALSPVSLSEEGFPNILVNLHKG